MKKSDSEKQSKNKSPRVKEVSDQRDQMLRSVLRNSPVAMYVIDQNHKIIYWNKALDRLSGIQEHVMIGTDDQWKLFYAEKRPTLADLLVDEAIESIEDLKKSYPSIPSILGPFRKSDLLEEAFEVTNYFPHFGKQGKWLHFTSAILRDQKGSVLGAIETFEDVTEQIHAEELYKALADASTVGIYVSQHERIIFTNRQFRTYTGYDEKEVTGMNPRDLIHPEDRKKAIEECRKMIDGERNAPYQFRIVGKDGSIRWIMETVSRIEYRGGRALLGNYLDITEQKEAEQELTSLKAVESSILDAIPVALVGLRERIITFANLSCKSVFGWEPEELIGKSTRKLYRTDSDYEEIGRLAYTALEKERTYKMELPCRRKDGRDIICMASGARIGAGLTNRNIIVTYDDITDQKAAEANLKRSYERLKRSMEDTIQTIAMIVETRDPYTAGHQKAVDKLAVAIAREMNLDPEKINGIHTAAVIHDIGKIYIPAEMLSKPVHLSEIEYDIMKTHPQVSYDILKRIDFPWPVAMIVYQHHERHNGSGYPRGLKGDEILIEARILAVADVVESMTSHRPYRPTIGLEKTIEEIKKNRGILYDPDVVDACLKLLSQGFKFQ